MNSTILFILDKLSHSAIIVLLIYLIAPSCAAQQGDAQWPFYLAFEDANGAKDTIWMIYDSSAAPFYGIDPALGEIPLENNTEEFRVWIYLDFEGNQYNTIALNLTFDFLETQIYSENYELPITVKWDSTLFTADILYESGDPINEAYFDNQYFFLVNNWWFNEFNMLVTDHTEMPYFDWGDGQHFPLFVRFTRGLGDPLAINGIHESHYLSVYPNPTTGLINIEFPKTVSGTLKIYTSNGKRVLSENVSSDRKQIDLQNEADGLYYAVYEDDARRIVKKVVLNK